MVYIRLEKIFHRDKERIGIFFQYKYYKILKSKLLSINAVFSNTKRCWHLPYNKENYSILLNTFEKVHVKLDNGKIVEKVAGKKSRDHLPIVQKNENIQVKPSKEDLNMESKSLDSAVHKSDVESISIAEKLGFTYEYDYGKYWVVKLHFQPSIKKQLLSIKGIYWNKHYSRYMMMRHPKVRKHVHAIFEQDLLPENYYFKDKQQVASGGELKFSAYEFDIRFMRVSILGNPDLKNQVKHLSMMRWDKTANCFLFPASPKMMDAFTLLIKGSKVNVCNILPDNYLKPKNDISKRGHQYLRTKDDLLEGVPVHAKAYIMELMNCIIAKHYSTHTLKNYTNAFITLLQHFEYRDPTTLKRNEVISFLAYVNEHCTSSSSVNNFVNALKFYFKYVLEWKDTKWEVPRPKREKKLPVVLTEAQVINLFKHVNNYKHKLILMLIYGSGLRISEAVDLKWPDIDFEQHKIHIKAAKGKKDRMVMLPYTLVKALQNYRRMFNPVEYVFAGQIKGQPYSPNSIRAIMRRAKKAAGIEQRATVHTLRHCFATHMLDSGTDIRFIQKILGHQSIKTTTIYTHVSKPKYDQIKSPLDSLSNREAK